MQSSCQNKDIDSVEHEARGSSKFSSFLQAFAALNKQACVCSHRHNSHSSGTQMEE